METELTYYTLDDLIDAMRAAELLCFDYSTRAVESKGLMGINRKYIITITNSIREEGEI